MEALNAQEQQELQTRMEKRQMRDFMSMYSKLVDKCFNACIDDFSSKSVSAREEGCILRCWDKNMKGQERVQLRFQEQNEAMMATGALQR